MSEQRFIDLETKMTHQEYLLEKLNKIVCQQQDQIDRLEETLLSLGKRLQEAQAGLEVGPANEKPPHY